MLLLHMELPLPALPCGCNAAAAKTVAALVAWLLRSRSCSPRCCTNRPPTSLYMRCYACRECWAQQPEERPTFDEVVGRLRQLLDRAPAGPA